MRRDPKEANLPAPTEAFIPPVLGDVSSPEHGPPPDFEARVAQELNARMRRFTEGVNRTGWRFLMFALVLLVIALISSYGHH